MPEKYEILAREYVVSLFPVFMLPHGLDEGLQARLGKSCAIFPKIEKNAVVWYFLPSQWNKAHQELVRRVKKNPDFLRRAFKRMEELGRRQVKETLALKKALTKKSNRELLRMYKKFVKSNIEVYSYGLLLPLLDYQETTFLSDELNAILQQHQAQKYFEILTAPRRDTYNKKQDLGLLRIFSSQEPAGMSSKIKKHAAQYAWVNYVYEGPAATPDYFIDILRDFAKRKVNPRQELKNHVESKTRLRARQNEIVRNLKLNKYEKDIAALARDAVFYKAYRRELQSWSYYHMEFLLSAIGQRLGLSLKQARMLLPQEIEKGLLGGKVDTSVINERLRIVVYISRRGKARCLAGRAALAFLKKNTKKERRAVGLSEIQGTVAFSGRAAGLVRVVNAPADMEKMRPGNILVSCATNPNLMPAIRQAAALVTDEGGLTCHAAIVAREFKIPCVVGTKIATQVLQDGDKVEVDAERGVVRKIINVS